MARLERNFIPNSIHVCTLPGRVETKVLQSLVHGKQASSSFSSVFQAALMLPVVLLPPAGQKNLQSD